MFFPYSNPTFLSIGANSSVSKRVTILTYVCSENIGGFKTVTIEVNIFSVINKKYFMESAGVRYLGTYFCTKNRTHSLRRLTRSISETKATSA